MRTGADGESGNGDERHEGNRNWQYGKERATTETDQIRCTSMNGRGGKGGGWKRAKRYFESRPAPLKEVQTTPPTRGGR